jgi:Family of unknown function (DUF6186)
VSASRSVTIAAFVCIGLSLVAIGRRERSATPPFGEMISYLMQSPTGRATTLASWVWIGWHFFGR